MRVLVAGASGVLGRAILPLLVQRGSVVLGITRSERGCRTVEGLGARGIICDVFDADKLRSVTTAFAPDVILHQLTDLPDQAGEIATRQSANARIRIEGTTNLLAAAEAAGHPRFLAQSVAWDLEPGSDTAHGVAFLERSVLTYGGVVLRYGRLYGAGTYYPDEPPAEPRLAVDSAAQATVALFDASTGIRELID